ncbi:MAG: hypothetical protein U0835_07010 [Isosphaeraceae bacterium]
MSQPSRPQAHGPAQRRRRVLKFEAVQPLEERCLLAPVLSISPRLAAFTANATNPTGVVAGGVVVTLGQPDAGFLTASPITSVTQLTPLTSFGGDIVRIRSGPGGDFGKGIYAISRGAGANGLASDDPRLAGSPARTITSAANRPGVIYRVDPATGKSSVFFDLNTVVSQLDPTASPGNNAGNATGLVNWYDITFDPEGYFDGRPSMFVASVDRSNPVKNAIYRIAPDGTFMGIFADFTAGSSALKFNVNPSAILVPPPEDQSFLRGLLAGGGVGSTTGTLSALYFDSNAYKPGQVLSSDTILPTGVSQTNLSLGPITGLTAANPDYISRIYSTFTDFGTPGSGGIPAIPGFSGVQGINGELLIGSGTTDPNGFLTATSASLLTNLTTTDSTVTDRVGAVSSDFRQFEDTAFDQYGYFAQGVNATATTTGGTGGGAAGTTGSVGGTGAGGGSGSGVGQSLGAGVPGIVVQNSTVTAITIPPANAGNLFVADLGTGLSVPVTPAATATDGTTITPAPGTVRFPVLGPELVQTTTNPDGSVDQSLIQTGPGLGGRVVRITADGTVRNFADNFNTITGTDSNGFALSSLSISFSADGTTLYVADDDAIWQFKTVASLAGSTSGSIVGLNDLRSLGVPYEGQDSAVAIVDTGVDANSSPFRGRVARGTNLITNGSGALDTAVIGNGTTTTGGGGTGGGTGGGGTTGNNSAPLPTADGHGTPVAGIVAQFVPQATIVPVNLFAPFLAVSVTAGGNGGGGGGGGIGGGGGGGTGTTATSGNSNTLTTSQAVYQAFGYLSSNPFVNDPIRPGKVDRVIAAVLGFGTTETFNSEGVAFKRYPQIVASFKNQLKKLRSLGIAPITAAGQFGAPFGSGGGGGNNGGNNGGGGNGGATTLAARNNAANANVGDVQGMSLPAILNEVISVTGTYPFAYTGLPNTPPTNPPIGVLPFPPQPVLLPTIGSLGNATGGNNNGGTGGNAATGSLLQTLTAGDFAIYSDRILASVNRSVVTDYAAPALDVPTFSRFVTNAATAATGGGGTTGGTGGGGTGTGFGTTFTGTPGNNFNFNTDQFGGTSASAAIVAGAYSVVSSALNYWATMGRTGVTTDAYLTQPVGARVLNYGPHAFKDLTAYNNPDGINSILQWTAVPAADRNDGLSAAAPFNAIGSPNFRNYSRISVSNAIAAIEGEIALQWLISHDQLKNIDANHNNIITATELQTFVDNAAKTGNAEAGAMARLLGGTARPPASQGLTGLTLAGEQPDQPDVLQRRFNFFDYAADGTLNGSVTIPQLTVLAHNLLPLPDSFVVVDRQRASANGYLVDPNAKRNFADLQHILPTYQFVSKSQVARFRNISPAKFHVDRGLVPGTTFPVYTLFSSGPARSKKGTTTPSPVPSNASNVVAANNSLSKPVTVAGGLTGRGTIAGTTVGSAAGVPIVVNSTTGQNSGATNSQAILDALTKLSSGGVNVTSTSAATTVTSTTPTRSVMVSPTTNLVPTVTASKTSPKSTVGVPPTTTTTSTDENQTVFPTTNVARPKVAKVTKSKNFFQKLFG